VYGDFEMRRVSRCDVWDYSIIPIVWHISSPSVPTPVELNVPSPDMNYYFTISRGGLRGRPVVASYGVQCARIIKSVWVSKNLTLKPLGDMNFSTHAVIRNANKLIQFPRGFFFSPPMRNAHKRGVDIIVPSGPIFTVKTKGEARQFGVVLTAKSILFTTYGIIFIAHLIPKILKSYRYSNET
tara:strand:+ start:2533 stop:3081 length:549 start_codon:yes stop_codon:yes gene_type:complete